jgi:hypothetical protein
VALRGAAQELKELALRLGGRCAEALRANRVRACQLLRLTKEARELLREQAAAEPELPPSSSFCSPKQAMAWLQLPAATLTGSSSSSLCTA